MRKRLVPALMAAALTLAVGTASSDPAEANRGRGGTAAGVAAGIFALGVLGAYRYRNDGYYYGAQCYPGPVRCHWVPGHCYTTYYGERVCRRGYERCGRVPICE